MSETIKSTKPENVRSSIALMERVIAEERGFSIICWVYEQGGFQSDPEVLGPDEHEGASCGMVACYGGWLAMSDEFRAAGGRSSMCWAPKINNEQGVSLENALAVAFWLGIPFTRAQQIVGTGLSNQMMDRYGEGEELHEFSTFYGVFLSDVTPQHVIKALQQLL